MKVSIIVPVYNVQDYLARCLDSLVKQTYQDIEIIIVNDGSKDDSKLIIDDYVKRYPKLIKAHDKENGGLSDARNYGLQYVKGEYLCFIDSDDYVEIDLIEKCLKQINDSDLLIYNFIKEFNDGQKEILPSKIKAGIYNLKEHPYLLAYTSNAAWNKIYKTSLFKENNILFPKDLLYEDLATTPRILSLCHKITYIDDVLYHYQVGRVGQIMSKSSLDIIKVIKLICDYYKEHQIFDLYYDELYYLCHINFIETLRNIINYEKRDDVLIFIEEIFKVKKEIFSKKSNKYEIIKNKKDYIYLNKLLCKCYYYMKRK